MTPDTVKEIKALSEALTPEVIRFLELSQSADTALMPIKGDVLIIQSEAAKTLHCNETTICRYVKEGLLKPVYTPHSRRRKFWLSEVKALATEEVSA